MDRLSSPKCSSLLTTTVAAYVNHEFNAVQHIARLPYDFQGRLRPESCTSSVRHAVAPCLTDFRSSHASVACKKG